MRAVIWTDVFQCAVMFGGLLTIIIKVSKMFLLNISGKVASLLNISMESSFSNKTFSFYISQIFLPVDVFI